MICRSRSRCRLRCLFFFEFLDRLRFRVVTQHVVEMYGLNVVYVLNILLVAISRWSKVTIEGFSLDDQ